MTATPEWLPPRLARELVLRILGGRIDCSAATVARLTPLGEVIYVP